MFSFSLKHIFLMSLFFCNTPFYSCSLYLFPWKCISSFPFWFSFSAGVTEEEKQFLHPPAMKFARSLSVPGPDDIPPPPTTAPPEPPFSSAPPLGFRGKTSQQPSVLCPNPLPPLHIISSTHSQYMSHMDPETGPLDHLLGPEPGTSLTPMLKPTPLCQAGLPPERWLGTQGTMQGLEEHQEPRQQHWEGATAMQSHPLVSLL